MGTGPAWCGYVRSPVWAKPMALGAGSEWVSRLSSFRRICTPCQAGLGVEQDILQQRYAKVLKGVCKSSAQKFRLALDAGWLEDARPFFRFSSSHWTPAGSHLVKTVFITFYCQEQVLTLFRHVPSTWMSHPSLWSLRVPESYHGKPIWTPATLTTQWNVPIGSPRWPQYVCATPRAKNSACVYMWPADPLTVGFQPLSPVDVDGGLEICLYRQGWYGDAQESYRFGCICRQDQIKDNTIRSQRICWSKRSSDKIRKGQWRKMH